MDLQAKIRTLPTSPGVYLYKDPEGKVIYVGKAVNLRSRVRSYLLENSHAALALENNLIKRYKPRFNILLRDDKTYPYIKLTAEVYPRVYVTRRLRKDGSTY